MGKKKEMQASLFHVAIENDVVYTPLELAQDMVFFFKPSGLCLDPCSGGGVFLDLLPAGSEWCEITKGRDFYAWNKQVDWCFGNPPYSHYMAWMEHSMKLSSNIVYLMPFYKMCSSGKFLDELFNWGGIVHVRFYGTGKPWGFPFGHALTAVHYQRGYHGSTSWSRYEAQQSMHLTEGGLRVADSLSTPATFGR